MRCEECLQNWGHATSNIASMPNGECSMHGGKPTRRPITHGLRTQKSKQNSTEVKYIINRINNTFLQIGGHI